MSNEVFIDLKVNENEVLETLNRVIDPVSALDDIAGNINNSIQVQIDKFIILGNTATINLQAVVIQYDAVSSASRKAEKATDAYAKSLGFVDKNDVAEKIKKMTNALAENADQYKKNPKLIDPLIKELEKLKVQAKQTGQDVGDAFKEQEEKIRAAKEETREFSNEHKAMATVLGISNNTFYKFAKAMDEFGKNLTKVAGGGKIVVGMLEDLDWVSKETAKSLNKIMDGIGQMAKGFSQLASNPITGTLNIIGGAIKSLTTLFGLFNDDAVGEAIDRERDYIQISEEMEKKIRKLEETLGDTHAAVSMLMADIIKEAHIHENNFDHYAKRVGEILSDFDNRKLSMYQVQESMGKAFNQLIAKAKKLGTEGSRELLNLIRDVRTRGFDIAQIQDYVNKKLEQGKNALKTYLSTFTGIGDAEKKIKALYAELESGNLTVTQALEKFRELETINAGLGKSAADVANNWDFMQAAALSTFKALKDNGKSVIQVVGEMGGELNQLALLAQQNNLEISGGLKDLTDLSGFIKQNEQLAKRIDATNQMMTALGDTAYFTADDFSSFSTNTLSQFDQLIAAGANEKQALMMLAPQMENLIKYADSYGFAIDDQTRALIDKARVEGVLNKKTISDSEKQVRLLESLVQLLGGEIPYAVDQLGGHVSGVMDDSINQTGQFRDNLDQLGQTSIEIDVNTEDAMREAAGLESEIDSMTGPALTAELDIEPAQLSLETLKNDFQSIDVVSIMAESVGNSFEEMISGADQFGIRGTGAMLQVIQNAVKLKRKGLEIPEVFEYLNENLTKGAEAFSNYFDTFDAKSVMKDIMELESKLQAPGLSKEDTEKIRDELKLKSDLLGDTTKDFKKNYKLLQSSLLSTITGMKKAGNTDAEIVRAMGEDIEILGRLAEENGLKIRDSFSNMLEMKSFAEDNDVLLQRIESTTQMMTALGETANLTENNFKQFARKANKNFETLKEDLEARGMESNEALKLMVPQLENIIKYSEMYGFKINKNTQSLIDQAENQKLLNQESMTDSQKQISLLESLVTLLGGDIPYAAEQMTETVTESMTASSENTVKLKETMEAVKIPDLAFTVETAEAIVCTGELQGTLDAVQMETIKASLDKEHAQTKAKKFKDKLDAIHIKPLTAALEKETASTNVDTFQTKLDAITVPRQTLKASWNIDEFPKHSLPRKFKVPIDWDFPKFPSIPGYASGTGGWIEVDKPTLFIAGEGGEKEYMNIIPHSKLSSPEDAPRAASHPEPLFPRNIRPYQPNRTESNTYNEYFIFENINLHTENGEDAVRDFMAAFKNNKLGVKTLIRKSVR